MKRFFVEGDKNFKQDRSVKLFERWEKIVEQYSVYEKLISEHFY